MEGLHGVVSVRNCCDELAANPCTAGGEEMEKIGSESEPRKKGGVRGRCFKIWLYFLIILF